jgi:predicted lipoprotein with Yx(FWY)xxD motif
MKRTLSLIALVLGAVALSACGSSSGNARSGGSPAASGSTKSDTVAQATVSGAGPVLVDAKGFALYSPSQEKGGKIVCTASCTKVWVPLTLPKGQAAPTAASGLGSKLGTIVRPDGRTQVTFRGLPLYTFALDQSPKSVSGNGAADSFGGKSFNWHVAALGRASSGGSSGSSGYYNSGGGY